MSYYYTYYVGYHDKETGLISILGPYDTWGKLKHILCMSRSFSSDLHNDFRRVSKNEVDDKVIKNFTYKNYRDEEVFELKMCEFKDLPDDNYIKTGFFLIEDVEQYLKTEDSYDLFYDKLDPTVYAAKSRNEVIFGVPEPEKDIEGNEFPVHSCGEYMWFAYPDYHSKEYEVWQIKQAVSMLCGWDDRDDIVILMEEG